MLFADFNQSEQEAAEPTARGVLDQMIGDLAAVPAQDADRRPMNAQLIAMEVSTPTPDPESAFILLWPSESYANYQEAWQGISSYVDGWDNLRPFPLETARSVTEAFTLATELARAYDAKVRGEQLPEPPSEQPSEQPSEFPDIPFPSAPPAPMPQPDVRRPSTAPTAPTPSRKRSMVVPWIVGIGVSCLAIGTIVWVSAPKRVKR